MIIRQGSIAASRAGHDKTRFFIVLKVEGSFAYIADGKERKLTSPKKKNIKHLALTDTVVSLPETDKELRKLLNSFSREN